MFVISSYIFNLLLPATHTFVTHTEFQLTFLINTEEVSLDKEICFQSNKTSHSVKNGRDDWSRSGRRPETRDNFCCVAIGCRCELHYDVNIFSFQVNFAGELELTKKPEMHSGICQFHSLQQKWMRGNMVICRSCCKCPQSLRHRWKQMFFYFLTSMLKWCLLSAT